MKIAITITLLALNHLVSISQTEAETSPLRFAKGGLGGTWQTRRDDLFSPLAFSGIGAELHLGSEKISDNWWKSITIWGSFNRMESRVKRGYNAAGLAFRAGVNYTLLHRVMPQQSQFTWYVGGQVFQTGNGMYYESNINNLLSFNLPFGLAAATRIAKEIRLFRRNWSVSSNLSLPLVAVNLRPNYLGFINDNIESEIGVASLNKLFFLDWKWMIDLPLSNGNRFRFTYRWEYWRDALNGTLELGSQTLLFETLLNLPYRQSKQKINLK